ncbi:RER1D-like protein [Drosera capensis]
MVWIGRLKVSQQGSMCFCFGFGVGQRDPSKCSAHCFGQARCSKDTASFVLLGIVDVRIELAAPHMLRRWLLTLGVATLYIGRVLYIQGFYVVSYGLATYVLNLLIGFLSPKVDPELEVLDGALSPTKLSDEYKPFERRVPEFKFWYSVMKVFLVSFMMTFISVLDVPVFWPILSSYWIFLLVLTLKRQIVHMFKYKYIPFRTGKPAVKYFLDPKTAEKVKFVKDSVELMRSYFDVENLPNEFGGKSTLEYDHKQVSTRMLEDDIKSEKFWGSATKASYFANGNTKAEVVPEQVLLPQANA